jgi:chromosome segregation ATPase
MRIAPYIHLRAAVIFAAVFIPAAALAQDGEARLREALSSAIAQTRALEDQRNQLQARAVKAEQDRDAARKQTAELNTKLKELRKLREDDKREFNERLAARDEVLEKWKAAYAEAATVARTKDAERLKAESEAGTLTAGLKECRKKNAELYRTGTELLARYEKIDIADLLQRREPVIGFTRVELENTVQEYRGKFLDQREMPAKDPKAK